MPLELHNYIFPPEMCYNLANPSITSVRTHKIDGTTLGSKAPMRVAPDIEPVRTFFWYTLRELMLHEAFTMLFGSAILSAHVPGQPEVAYELPAQSPQNVMSKMMEWFEKNVIGLQPVGDSCAAGSPQPDGFGD